VLYGPLGTVEAMTIELWLPTEHFFIYMSPPTLPATIQRGVWELRKDRFLSLKSTFSLLLYLSYRLSLSASGQRIVTYVVDISSNSRLPSSGHSANVAIFNVVVKDVALQAALFQFRQFRLVGIREW
jgi:hypothetical protein